MTTFHFAPAQRSAALRLLFGVLALVAAVGVLLARGMESYLHDDTARRLIVLIALSAIVFWLLDSILTKRIKDRGESVLDERDRSIVYRATHWTMVGVLFYVFVGGIVLTEIFYNDGGVPVSVVFLSAMSVQLVSFIMQAALTLIAYWRDADRVEL